MNSPNTVTTHTRPADHNFFRIPRPRATLAALAAVLALTGCTADSKPHADPPATITHPKIPAECDPPRTNPNGSPYGMAYGIGSPRELDELLGNGGTALQETAWQQISAGLQQMRARDEQPPPSRLELSAGVRYGGKLSLEAAQHEADKLSALASAHLRIPLDTAASAATYPSGPSVAEIYVMQSCPQTGGVQYGPAA